MYRSFIHASGQVFSTIRIPMWDVSPVPRMLECVLTVFVMLEIRLPLVHSSEFERGSFGFFRGPSRAVAAGSFGAR
jgi:hypothetical protein